MLDIADTLAGDTVEQLGEGLDVAEERAREQLQKAKQRAEALQARMTGALDAIGQQPVARAAVQQIDQLRGAGAQVHPAVRTMARGLEERLEQAETTISGRLEDQRGILQQQVAGLVPRPVAPMIEKLREAVQHRTAESTKDAATPGREESMLGKLQAAARAVGRESRALAGTLQGVPVADPLLALAAEKSLGEGGVAQEEAPAAIDRADAETAGPDTAATGGSETLTAESVPADAAPLKSTGADTATGMQETAPAGGTGAADAETAAGETATGAPVPAAATTAEAPGPEGAAKAEAPGPAGATAEAPMPADAMQSPTFQAMTSRIRQTARRTRLHAPARSKVKEAQSAVEGPKNEVSSRAAARQVDRMAAVQPKRFDRNAFLQALRARVAQIDPKSAEELASLKERGVLGPVQRNTVSYVEQRQREVEGELKQRATDAPDATGLEPKPFTKLPAPDPGTATTTSVRDAVPAPLPEETVSLESKEQALEQHMQEAGISETRLEQAHEPSFDAALQARHEARVTTQEMPERYREREQLLREQAGSEAEEKAARAFETMFGARTGRFGEVHGHQQRARQREELERAEVARQVEAIYQDTRTRVQSRLTTLDDQVGKAFDAGATRARLAFEGYVARRLREEGVTGAWLRAAAGFLGLPDGMAEIYESGRRIYLEHMEREFQKIATQVEEGLAAARQEIAEGRQRLKTLPERLSGKQKQYALEAIRAIEDRFGDLERTVDGHQESLVETLAQRYVDVLAALNKELEDKRKESEGVFTEAWRSIDEVKQTLAELRALLKGVLGKAAEAATLILADPLTFVGNLFSGVKAGVSNFLQGIEGHVTRSLSDWLLGELSGAGIKLPERLDAAGILSLTLQVLDLAYAGLRARAVALLGEPAVSTLEKTAELFQVLRTEGPGGLWRLLKEQLGGLADQVVGQLKTMLMGLVAEAVAKKILPLLTPATALVSAVMSLYEMLKFFVMEASRIGALVDAVVESVLAIAKGDVSGAAKWIEGALGRTLPLVLKFLAGQLGLGSLAKYVRKIFEAVRARVRAAVDWVIEKAMVRWKGVGKRKGSGLERATSGPERGAEVGPKWSPEPIVLLFEMGDLNHTLTIVPESSRLSILMASSKAEGLVEKYRVAVNTLDDWYKFFVDAGTGEGLADPELKSLIRNLFTTDQTLGPEIRKFVSETTKRHAELYRSYQETNDRTELDKFRQSLAARAQNLIRHLQEWAAEMGIDELTATDLDKEIAKQGEQIFTRLYKARKEAVETVLANHKALAEQIETPPNSQLRIEYRGSLVAGKRGAHKGGIRLNTNDFDIDAFVLSEKVWNQSPGAKTRNARDAVKSSQTGNRNLVHLVSVLKTALKAIPGVNISGFDILIRKIRI